MDVAVNKQAAKTSKKGKACNRFFIKLALINEWMGLLTCLSSGEIRQRAQGHQVALPEKFTKVLERWPDAGKQRAEGLVFGSMSYVLGMKQCGTEMP